MYKKIDLFYDGTYLCSTNMHKKCKDAKDMYLAATTIEKIKKEPKKLKAYFDKEGK